MLKSNFLKNFINKINNLPSWLKSIVYEELSKNDNNKQQMCIEIAKFQPTLSFMGLEELNNKRLGFDSTTYRFLDSCKNNENLAEFMLNNFLSMQDVAGILNFCINESLIEKPTDDRIINLINYLSGKKLLGEFLLSQEMITQQDLDLAINKKRKNDTLKIGEYISQIAKISQKEITNIVEFKNDYMQRFVLDANEIPNIKNICNDELKYKQQINSLTEENKKLKYKLEKLLTLVNAND